MRQGVSAVKKLLIVVSIVPIFFLAGCRPSGNVPEENMRASNPAGEMLALFDLHWELGEDAETGKEFMHRFKEDPVPVLEALAIATPFQREQMLVLIGSTIASALRIDPLVHAEYLQALELAAGLDLDEDSVRMLGFVHANIAYFSGK